MIYLDTSAFLKLYLREDGSEYVQACLESQDEPVPMVDVLQWEFANAVRLKVFWKDIGTQTADHLLALFEDRLFRGQYAVMEIDAGRRTRDVQTLVRHTEKLGCRTLDVLHVATALQLSPERFVSFDERQRSLARAFGMRVVPEAAAGL